MLSRDQMDELADEFIRPPYLIVPDEIPEEEL